MIFGFYEILNFSTNRYFTKVYISLNPHLTKNPVNTILDFLVLLYFPQFSFTRLYTFSLCMWACVGVPAPMHVHTPATPTTNTSAVSIFALPWPL
ncbi:hypothetical protein SAMN06269173_110141 [Hymenobacter mucosus]|uniref:Uncharacterized protein n=1 Tax=Hymenobacter mucosus TaxID=1411120 RepID=A0A239A1S8_9BACT|nr:hypothetical protein SAMN06269173_110141 [Hymenobacter mucosus]